MRVQALKRGLRRLRSFVVAAAVAGVAWRDLAGADLPSLRAERSPSFTADVAVSVDTAGRPGLSVTVSIPYEELQWIRIPAGYGAGIELTVVFQPKRGVRSFGDSWERRIVAGSFDHSRSPSFSITERRTFRVPPGRYEVRVEAHDVNSEATSSARSDLEVPDYSRVPVGFADLELGVADSSDAFQPLPTRLYGLNVRRLAVRLALFDRRPGDWPRVYPFRYRILDDQGEPIVSGRRPITSPRSAAPLVLRPDSSELFIGTYVFEVTLEDDASHWRSQRTFDVEESGPPRGLEFDRILEPLSYVAESGEIDHLRGVPATGQAAAWDEFWKRRDPTPETARNEALIEFLRRLRYAEQHFQSFGPGWRSDMGRIYIKFGTPDQTESRAPTTDSPQLEVWYYNRPYRRFVFADREGFGRYVLIGPAAE